MASKKDTTITLLKVENGRLEQELKKTKAQLVTNRKQLEDLQKQVDSTTTTPVVVVSGTTQVKMQALVSEQAQSIQNSFEAEIKHYKERIIQLEKEVLSLKQVLAQYFLTITNITQSHISSAHVLPTREEKYQVHNGSSQDGIDTLFDSVSSIINVFSWSSSSSSSASPSSSTKNTTLSTEKTKYQPIQEILPPVQKPNDNNDDLVNEEELNKLTKMYTI